MIDLRSDSSIPPSALMREAMAQVTAGDDFFGESETTRSLEQRCASLLGKNSAVLVPTGTMANAIAILATECEADRIFMDARSHIFLRERSRPGVLATLHPETSDRIDGCPDHDAISKWLERDNRPATICTENTHLWRGGITVPPAELDRLRDITTKHHTHIHMDGARLFNAATALAISPATLANTADSVMCSLVKGLGAPCGVILAGTTEFIEKARNIRHIIGGTIRQSGLFAAAAHIALDEGLEYIHDDHFNARLLASNLGIREVETNIVLIDPAPFGLSAAQILDAAANQGVKLSTLGPLVRAVTHRGIKRDDIANASAILANILSRPS